MKGAIFNWTKPSESKGGVESAVFGLAKILNADIFSAADAARELKIDWLLQEEDRRRFMDYAIAIAEYVKKIEDDYDFFLFMDSVAAFVETKRPVISFWVNPFKDIADLLYQKGYYDFKAYAHFGKFLPALQRLALQRSPVNVVLSEYILDYMQRNIGGDEFKVVSCFGIPKDWASRTGSKEQERRRLGLPAEKIIGLFIGSLHPAYGVKITETLANENPDILWIFVFKHLLNAKITVSKVEISFAPNMLIYQVVADELMPSIFKACDFLLAPTPYEGGCIRAVEAMMCDCSVITGNTGFFYKMRGPTAFGYVVEDWDVGAYREGLKFVLKHLEEFSPKEYAKEHFDYNRYAQFGRQLISSVVNKSPIP